MPFDDDLSGWEYNPFDTPEIADLWGNGDDEITAWEFDFSDDNGALVGWDDDSLEALLADLAGNDTLEALLSDLSDLAGNDDLSDILTSWDDTPL